MNTPQLKKNKKQRQPPKKKNPNQAVCRFDGAEQMSEAAEETESALLLITIPEHTDCLEMSWLTLLSQQVQGVNNQNCLMYLNFVQWVI